MSAVLVYHRHRGLSPHVRGNRFSTVMLPSGIGSIPARAGEPSPHRTQQGIHRVYPRTCGGTLIAKFQDKAPEGLSPHVRGNQEQGVHGGRGDGSIPARAGEPGACSPG